MYKYMLLWLPDSSIWSEGDLDRMFDKIVRTKTNNLVDSSTSDNI